ncbi:PREDICTED: uncharacterized protein LOC109205245 [Nicotiana attenuata]|uniref:uncharacterized protein LOC109205245 n=1 Tax=Nicotiana attenuata TaxID=49451 RepID=UPI000905B456|nr:PREDICTED: uncharacterized protein LOC109205245 [Nicotiana attenuata]
MVEFPPSRIVGTRPNDNVGRGHDGNGEFPRYAASVGRKLVLAESSVKMSDSVNKNIENHGENVQALTQGLNERSSAASRQLKENLIEYPVLTWSDIHNRYQSKIRVEDDQLGAPSGSGYPSRLLVKEPNPNKERYQPYTKDRRNSPRHNPPHDDRSMNRGQNPRGLINRTGKIRDAKWPRPVQSDPSQRSYDLVCEFHNAHGHRTEDCRQLREEVARLLDNGHLREFLSDRAKNQSRERETTKNNKADKSQRVIHTIF